MVKGQSAKRAIRFVARVGKQVLENVDKEDVDKLFHEVVQPAAQKIAPIAKQKVEAIGQSGARAVNQVIESAAVQAEKARSKKEDKKTSDAIRKQAIDRAICAKDAAEFFTTFEENAPDDNDFDKGFMPMSGCFAILSFPSLKVKDLKAYSDVYVGQADSVGLAVYRELSGFGNADVYADFKYKKPMRVLVYPCEAGQREACYMRLLEEFQARDSYNKWDLNT